MSRKSKPTALFDLNEREIDILRCIANGMSNQEIADRFVFTLNTVRWYNKQIYSKLGVHSRTLLWARARELGLLEDAAPVADVSAARSVSLPLVATPFIGRRSDLVTLRGYLDQPQCRLLTLTGVGGIGKTRLAIQLASESSSEFRDGVSFVGLSSLESTDYIVTTIIMGLGLRIGPGSDPTQYLLRNLSARQMIIVLDNFEHLLDASGLVRDILDAAPDVRLVVTSRERLNLNAEWLYELRGLETTSNDEPGQIADAVELFHSCARRHSTHFEPTFSDDLIIVKICNVLNAMPFAIEQAASWVRYLSVEEILRELELNTDFLAVSHADLPERHRKAWHIASPS